MVTTNGKKLLSGTVEAFVEASCFPRRRFEHLCCGVGQSAKDPLFLGWKCVNNTCNACSVEKNLNMGECPIWRECTIEIDVLEWVHADCQGTKNGKQNTQLELGSNRYKVCEVLHKVMKQLRNANRPHQAQYEWKGWMRKIDMLMSHPYQHRIICTNFGATLDLFAMEKDNSSVNNHAVLCIYFVLTNRRKVSYEINEGNKDTTIVNDCDKWLFFGDTISRGKKNDHVFHNNCLTYLIQFYDNEIKHDGKDTIPFNIVHTDNCAPQYKCRQNFLQLSKSFESLNTMVIHKFAQKYRFKGSWDAAGKLVKQAIHRLEMKNERCANANDCYFKLINELPKDGSEASTKKLEKYEQLKDKCVLGNTTLRTRRTFVGLGTKKRKSTRDWLVKKTRCAH